MNSPKDVSVDPAVEAIMRRPSTSWSPSEKKQFLDWLGMDEDVWDKLQELPSELQQKVYDLIDFLHDTQEVMENTKPREVNQGRE